MVPMPTGRGGLPATVHRPRKAHQQPEGHRGHQPDECRGDRGNRERPRAQEAERRPGRAASKDVEGNPTDAPDYPPVDHTWGSLNEMPRFVIPAAGAALLVCAASAAASPVMTVRAEGEYAAEGEATRVVPIPRRHSRVRVTYDATITVRPYTYDDSYNRVYGPDTTRPIPTADGSVTFDCRKTARAPWYTATTTSRTFLAGITTMRLPMRGPAQCRVRLSVSDWPTAADQEKKVAVRLTASLTTLR
jgi:hypothetical protein